VLKSSLLFVLSGQHEDSGAPMPTLCQPRRRFCQLR
jgi:hypothetical protein